VRLAILSIGLMACGRIGFDFGADTPADGDLIDDGAIIDSSEEPPTDASVTCADAMAKVTGTGADFCIDLAEVGVAKRQEAATICASTGKVMCSKSRLFTACAAAPVGVIDLTDDWEWSKDYGSLISVYAVNEGTCGVDTFFNEANNHTFRCCSP
jgi:hypothetical protein